MSYEEALIIAQIRSSLSRIIAKGAFDFRDDCAQFQRSVGHKKMMMTCDQMISGRHFLWQEPAHSVGYRCVQRNLSDLYAAGASPREWLWSLAVSKTISETQWFMDFLQGVLDACLPHNFLLLGGDVSRFDVKEDLFHCSFTAIGAVAGERSLTCSGAKIGDLICVSKSLGAAATQRNILHKALNKSACFTNKEFQEKFGEYLWPEDQQTKTAYILASAHSCTDISDGLIPDLWTLLKADNLGAQLLQAEGYKADCASVEEVYFGGEDYALLFTLAKNTKALPEWVAIVGEVIGERQILDAQGKQLMPQKNSVHLIYDAFA